MTQHKEKERIALLLIAHGSRRAEANRDLEWLAAAMREKGKYHHVQTSYLELTEPTIHDGGLRCVEAGAERVVMVPYFLSPGVHVREDLIEAKEILESVCRNVKFSLVEPLGRHPLLIEIVGQRIEEGKAS